MLGAVRANYDEIVDIKEHVELVKEVKEEVAKEYDLLTDELEDAIAIVDTKLNANQELLNGFMGEVKGFELGKTLKDF